MTSSFADKPFIGASVGYFSFLFLLAGRALTVSYSRSSHLSFFLVFLSLRWQLFSLQVLLSPPIVVYSPRVLPVYVYDAHADCAKNVRLVRGFISLQLFH